jgi:hypothetical protein
MLDQIRKLTGFDFSMGYLPGSCELIPFLKIEDSGLIDLFNNFDLICNSLPNDEMRAARLRQNSLNELFKIRKSKMPKNYSLTQ